MEIGSRLKNARNEHGLTQEQVAEELGVSRQSISNWENNRAYPDIISVIRMSDLYSVSLDELLKEDKKMIEHLAESTDMVNNQRELVKRITIIVYWGLWGLIFLCYWLILVPSGGYSTMRVLGSKELFFYMIYPICIAFISGFIGANKSFGNLKWLYVPISGIMLMILDLITGYFRDSMAVRFDSGIPLNLFEVICHYFADNIKAWIPTTFVLGCVGCAAGILIGMLVRRTLINQKERS